MQRTTHLSPRMIFITGSVLLTLAVSIVLTSRAPATAQQDSNKPFATPPEGQTFVGSKQCSACHFDQFMAWRKTKHARAFDILPAKYKSDSNCLKCHTTGFGQETGYKTAADSGLIGTSCEACHGPGSKHGEIAKTFANKKLSDAEKKYVGSSIHKVLPGNACITCHAAQSHKKHPDYDK